MEWLCLDDFVLRQFIRKNKYKGNFESFEQLIEENTYE
jgi:hypothetical protein